MRSFSVDYTRGMHRIAITVAAIVALLCGAGSAWATSGDDVDAGARFEKYLSQAEKSDVDAQAILDIMYDNGWYVAENKAEAFKWFLRAAEQGQEANRKTALYLA